MAKDNDGPWASVSAKLIPSVAYGKRKKSTDEVNTSSSTATATEDIDTSSKKNVGRFRALIGALRKRRESMGANPYDVDK